jgi:uncharacterized membrane protein
MSLIFVAGVVLYAICIVKSTRFIFREFIGPQVTPVTGFEFACMAWVALLSLPFAPLVALYSIVTDHGPAHLWDKLARRIAG